MAVETAKAGAHRQAHHPQARAQRPQGHLTEDARHRAPTYSQRLARPLPVPPGEAVPPRSGTSAAGAFAHAAGTRPEGARVHDDPTVAGLVARAQDGDQQAWDVLVERYAPVVWSICRRYRLGRADAEDVSQNVWLRLASQLGNLRDPAAVAGWLSTTTRRECSRALRAARSPQAAVCVPDVENIPDSQSGTAEQDVLTAERHAALREALTDLPPHRQRLLALLIEDPPVPYAQISATLGIPVGSIGPSRRRSLDKLRRHPAIAALMNGGDELAAAAQPALFVRDTGGGVYLRSRTGRGLEAKKF
jgi:RNA polymerase sigma factor (sigma-70 family)